MMELYYELNKYIINKDDKIFTNLYSKYNWNDLIPNDPIIAQEIDIIGKCRVIQTQSGFTIQIPPSAPLNVPLIKEYTSKQYEEIIEIFGNPNSKDDDGVYYPYHTIPNMVYILCSNTDSEDSLK